MAVTLDKLQWGSQGEVTKTTNQLRREAGTSTLPLNPTAPLPFSPPYTRHTFYWLHIRESKSPVWGSQLLFTANKKTNMTSPGNVEQRVQFHGWVATAEGRGLAVCKAAKRLQVQRARAADHCKCKRRC